MNDSRSCSFIPSLGATSRPKRNSAVRNFGDLGGQQPQNPDRRPPGSGNGPEAAQNGSGGGGRTLGSWCADGLVTKDVERVAACIDAGGLAVVPTETVYGLGGRRRAAGRRRSHLRGQGTAADPPADRPHRRRRRPRPVGRRRPAPRRRARRDVLAGTADAAAAADRRVSPTPSPAAATRSASACPPTRRPSTCWRAPAAAWPRRRRTATAR